MDLQKAIERRTEERRLASLFPPLSLMYWEHTKLAYYYDGMVQAYAQIAAQLQLTVKASSKAHMDFLLEMLRDRDIPCQPRGDTIIAYDGAAPETIPATLEAVRRYLNL